MSTDLWVLGKPAKSFPSDWLVVPVKDAVEHEAEAVRLEQKRIFDWIDAKILEAQENQVCFDEYFSSGDLPEGCDSDYDAFKKRVLEGSE